MMDGLNSPQSTPTAMSITSGVSSVGQAVSIQSSVTTMALSVAPTLVSTGTSVMNTATGVVPAGYAASAGGLTVLPSSGVAHVLSACSGSGIGAGNAGGVSNSGFSVGPCVPNVPNCSGACYNSGGFNFGANPSGQAAFTTGQAGFTGFGFPRAGLTTTPIKLDNVPKMKGSFDLYAVQLRAFLIRMGCWSVVDGTFNHSNPLLGARFSVRDNVARESILSGVPAQDAEMICQEDTAQAMWNRFVDKQTKREYSNYIFARAEFYSNVYTTDKSMEQWLRDMESLRKQLLHYGKRVSDDDYAETLLGHVARTHRDVVRQFSKHYIVRRDGGADRPVPSANQVMNTLRAESALDEKIGAEEQKPAGVAACGKQSKQQNKNQGGKKRKRGTHNKKTQKEKKQQGKQETRTCYHCGEVGHLRPNCPERNQESSEDKRSEKDFTTSERKRWQNKSGNDSKKKKVDAVGIISRDSLTVSSVTESRGGCEWVLDSASDVRVCNRQNLLSELENDSTHVFQGYDGGISGDEKVGNVQLQIKNSKQPHQDVVLKLKNVLFKSSAPDNLLSLDVMEKDGWNWKTGFRDSRRVAWLSKGKVQLLLVKTRGRYRLEATPSTVFHVPSLRQCSQVVSNDAERGATGDQNVAVPVEAKKCDADSLGRWHLRFAHLNFPALKQMARQQVTVGMNNTLHDDLDTPCWSCRAAKMTRMSYKKMKTRRAIKPYQKLMSDMCYMGIVTYDGYSHFQLVQDEASRYLWGFLMRRKEEASDVVLAQVKWLLAQGHKIEVFNSDQGRELLNNNKMTAYLTAHGIEYTWTNGYSPEENGLVERMNGIVAAQVRCILTTANMPNLLWGEAFNFAVEVRNISATKALDGETPYFVRFGECPDVSKLRIWGYLVFVFTPMKLRKNKLENPGKAGLFMGFAKHSESFRVLSLVTGNVQEVRAVDFHEEWTVDRSYVDRLLANRYGKGRARSLPTVIPFVRLPVTGVCHDSDDSSLASGEHPSKRRRCDCDATTFQTEVGTPVYTGEPVVAPLRDPEFTRPAAVGDQPWVRGVNPSRIVRAEVDIHRGVQGPQDAPNSHSCDGQQPGMSRGTSPSVGEEVDDGEVSLADAADEVDDLEKKVAAPIASGEPEADFDLDFNDDKNEEELSDTTESFRRSRRVRWPNRRYQDYNVELPASLVIESANMLMEPQSVQEALAAPDAEKWKKALEKEYKDLMRNNTWELVERPKNEKVLTSKWVFVRKKDAQGNVVRHRTCITIKGCQQRYGVNYWETYAPVVAQESVKFILLLALHLALSARHVDFVTAFLNGPIGEGVDIYMEMPEYFDDGSGRVCKLLRSLYGLKQAPLIWYQTLDKYLRSCGFRRTKMDGGLYTRSVGGSPIFVAVYVDDLIIVGTDENIELVLRELRAKFEIKDLGAVTDLLHMEVSYIPGEMLWMSQRGYIDKVLKRFGMEDCRPVATPQALGDLPEPADEHDPGVNDPNIPYRELVGCLQYLVQGTRPEIANAVRTLGKYMSKYTKEHFTAAKRVLRYLQGTRDYGLLWKKSTSSDLHFIAYADADLGSERTIADRSLASCFR